MRLVLIVSYASFECSGEIHAPLECESKEELYCKLKEETKAQQDALDAWYANMRKWHAELRQATAKGKTMDPFTEPKPASDFDFTQWGWHHKLDLDLFWHRSSNKLEFIEPVIYTIDEWFAASAAMKL